ncbi:transcriptional regulator with XRE-family HTH domain [Kitasatospora sp. MAP12-15]|uniref:helix-turn-helix transcriptional regulator n=1 Tax=unclassified Kitasatospora TaxID=2633591 RepID=UPI00247DE956|nr:transcriptional regulator with XRE-family HTH domain [Kitasatospora sp. MAP12-44]
MSFARRRLAQRRKSLGYSQESIAAELQVDRSTIGRWERGEVAPQPHIRPRLSRLLQVTPTELDTLLATPLPVECSPVIGQAPRPMVTVDTVVPGTYLDVGDLDSMNRREFLQLVSITGTLVALSPLDLDHADRPVLAAVSDIDEHEMLNSHLWQVFSLAKSKPSVYPLVRHQLSALAASLAEARGEAAHKRLCALVGDLFQLAGEIFFDSNRYTDAAYCYTLATSASKEADAYDLWACGLTRHAFIGMHERRFAKAIPLLNTASQVAQRGDGELSTRHWVAAYRPRHSRVSAISLPVIALWILPRKSTRSAARCTTVVGCASTAHAWQRSGAPATSSSADRISPNGR